MNTKVYTYIDGVYVELKYNSKTLAFAHPPIKVTQAKAKP